MGKSLSTSFTQGNGTPVQIPGAGAWEVISGAAPTVSSNELLFSTAGSSNPIYGIDVGVRINGKNDVDVSMLPKHVYGNALYFRIVDANNWLRARLWSDYSSSDVYITEYQYNEIQWRDRYQGFYQESLWQPKKLQRQIYWVNYYYPAWSTVSWQNTGEQTACRIDAPTYGIASDYDSWGVEVTQYRWVSNGMGVGCAADKSTYRKQSQSRSRSNYSAGYSWVDDGYSLVYNVDREESFTGSTQVVNNGSTYWAVSASGPYDTYAGQNRYVSTGYYYKTGTNQSSPTVNPGQTTSANDGDDQYVDTSASATGATYWATSPTISGPADTATGSSRQVYSHTNYTYYYGYLTLEKREAGAISTIGSTYYSASSTPQVIRAKAKGTALEIYYGGTLRISATESANATGPKIGAGGGVSSYNQTMARVDDFSFTILTPMRLRVGTSWINVERPKIRVGTTWVDHDPKGY